MAARPLAGAAAVADARSSSHRSRSPHCRHRNATLVQLGRLQCRRWQRRAAAAVGLRVVATSEHWYEDEEEFDALTDAMKSKLVVLVAAPTAGEAGAATTDAAVDALRAFLQPLKFVQAFSSQQALQFAQRVWAGRDKAPYFLRVRQRTQLDAAAAGAQDQQVAAAEGVWAELLQQNWRVELDAGLGAAAVEREALLIFAAPAAVAQLLAAAQCSSGAPTLEGEVHALEVEGTQAGDPLDWRGLGKRLVLAAAQPGQSSGTIQAALEAAAAGAAAQ
ncbi:hypothetical protein ABPG77_004798 [Micractinium sp. CCAP 211/92]